MAMLTRSRSSSIDIAEDSENACSSQSTPVVSRQLSSASSYFDSQDSVAIDEISSKSKTKRKINKTKPLQALPDCNQRVMILLDSALNSENLCFISLPHPKTKSSSSLFLLSKDSSTIYEINRCTDSHRSWFIGETIQTDGSLTVCTPMDPLLLVLPLIKAFKLDKFTTIETLLSFDTTPYAHILSNLISQDQWLNICDKKVMVGDSLCVYRYNKDKTMNWLTKKVTLLSTKLIADDVYIGTGSRISGFRQSKNDTNMSKEEYLHYASGMIGEYLPTDLCNDLLTLYPSTLKTTKRKISSGLDTKNEPLSKRSNAEPTEDYSNAVKTANTKTKLVSKVTAGIRALEKVDKKGMKSLKSFFCKKSK